jgi:hypothetical protein
MSELCALLTKNIHRNQALIPVVGGENITKTKLGNLVIKLHYLREVTDIITSLLPHKVQISYFPYIAARVESNCTS